MNSKIKNRLLILIILTNNETIDVHGKGKLIQNMIFATKQIGRWRKGSSSLARITSDNSRNLFLSHSFSPFAANAAVLELFDHEGSQSSSDFFENQFSN